MTLIESSSLSSFTGKHGVLPKAVWQLAFATNRPPMGYEIDQMRGSRLEDKSHLPLDHTWRAQSSHLAILS